MQELAETLANWHKNNTNYAIALVTQTWRSAPRPVGTIMALNEDQKIIGSVSGGCIEGAVAEELMKAINTGESALLHYGIQNETAWQYGLSCGGQIEILIFPINQSQTPTKLWNQAIQYAIDKQPFGLLFQCSNLPNHPLTKELSYQRDTPLFSAKSGYVSLSGKEYFAWIHPPVPNLYIVGGAHLSAELVFLANHFGFQTTVVDPRGFFTEHTQYEVVPHSLINDWPAPFFENKPLTPFDFGVVLSHDPKIDDQALSIFLTSPIKYIGALGSKKNQEKRKIRLLEKGFTEENIARIHGPIGLDINAASAREIALSIISQMIQIKNQS
jgi:xanthine dehydrogenase accessory factor